MTAALMGSLLVVGAFAFATNSTGVTLHGKWKGIAGMTRQFGSGSKGSGDIFHPEMNRWLARWMWMGWLSDWSRNSEMMSGIRNAIQSNDYLAYKKAYTQGMMTQDQFNDMVVKHKQMTAMREAVENNDYSAFSAAIKGTPMENNITQAQFATMYQRQQGRGQSISTTK